MKLYDGFVFNDELDLLELRLTILDPVVDYFVLVEIPYNFQQREKPLIFHENRQRFAKWLPKIRVVTPEDIQVGPHPIIEYFQRRLIARGFYDAEPRDWLMVSDVDEIPDPAVLETLKNSALEHPVALEQVLSYYYVNCRVPLKWHGTVAFPRLAVKDIDCESLREHRVNFPRLRGGWHYSWLGSTEQIQHKLRSLDAKADVELYNCQSFMHTPDADNAEFLAKCREHGLDLFGRDLEFKFVPIQEGVNQPVGIEDWLDKYPHYAKRDFFLVSDKPEERVARWIKAETAGCKSVLDLGCGRAQYTMVPGAPEACGIDSFEPYIEDCKARIPTATFACGNILDYRKLNGQSHDVALLIDVIEHLEFNDSCDLLLRLQEDVQKILVFTPLGYHEQGEIDGNEAQAHISTWYPRDLEELGFRVVSDPVFHHTNPAEKQGAMFAVWEKAAE